MPLFSMPFLFVFLDELHLASRIPLQTVRLAAVVTQPVELRCLADGLCRKLKQFPVAEVAELGRAARIMTLGDHGQSCAMGLLREWMPA